MAGDPEDGLTFTPVFFGMLEPDGTTWEWRASDVTLSVGDNIADDARRAREWRDVVVDRLRGQAGPSVDTP